MPLAAACRPLIVLLLLVAGALAGCAGIEPSETAASGRTVMLVRDDPGGDVIQYESKFRRWAKEKASVKVDGLCASACTLLLAYLPAEQVCLTPRAKFGFHSAAPSRQFQVASLSTVGIGFRASTPAADLTSLEIYQLYPAWLRRQIDRQAHQWGNSGPLPPSNSLLVLNGAMFLGHGHPSC